MRKPVFIGKAAILLVVSTLALTSCFPKTEMRTCIDSTGSVQPDQLCIRGDSGVMWAYGGMPDPDRKGYLKDYKLEPTAGSNVVSGSGKN